MMEEFIKPWMKRCNPQLILRFWRSKGLPGKLTLKQYGFEQVFTNTPFGEVVYHTTAPEIWLNYIG
jgi:hypothetical protein